MKIIILGSNGMLGTYLQTYLKDKYELILVTRKNIDFSSSCEEEIINFLSKITDKNDIIINSCGVIKQREYNLFDLIKVNSLLPNILSKLKKIIGCEVIHITTDCVFNGLKGNYIETDEHDCIDDYGKSKSLGENNEITIIRTSIIGEEILNKKSLLEWVVSNKNNTIYGYENHLWNGVTCLELSIFIDKLIKSKTYWNGVKHFFSKNTVSKYELINNINEIYNLKINIIKKRTNTDCFRNLSTIFNEITEKTIYEQIIELKKFELNKK